MRGSTAKSGISKANSLALLGLSTPEALRGCRLPRSRGVELQDTNSFAFRLMSNPELREGADSHEAAMLKPYNLQSQQFGSSGCHTATEQSRAPRGIGRLPIKPSAPHHETKVLNGHDA
jgi:hypothetical protein